MAKKEAQDAAVRIQLVPLGHLEKWPRNPKGHDIPGIRASLEKFGFVQVLVIDEKTGRMVAGHGRLEALLQIKQEGRPAPNRIVVRDDDWYVPVLRGISFATERDAEEYLLVDNRLGERGGWVEPVLSPIFVEYRQEEFTPIGWTNEEMAGVIAASVETTGEGNGGRDGEKRPSLADRFIIPPFSVLNAREGWWQDRKRAWIACGIQSELGRCEGPHTAVARQSEYKLDSAQGRGKSITWGNSPRGQDTKGEGKPYTDKAKRFGKTSNIATDIGREMKSKEGRGENLLKFSEASASFDNNRKKEGTRDHTDTEGTSIFDPVLCELVYRWFCPSGGQVVDPFAGGSVRGIVAARLGRRYWGCDLRAEQVRANEEQGAQLCPKNTPVWVTGDAVDVLPSSPAADFVLSCPPYGDLERYSDDPHDLSTMQYDEFVVQYRRIVKGCADRLNDDTFACFVVGEFRDKRGAYHNFVGDTVQAFQQAGLQYYNEAILVTAVGSLPIRAAKQFSVSRKLGKTHQNVLVFCKGDPKKAAQKVGEVEFGKEDLSPGPQVP
jgi:hypothetical protein